MATVVELCEQARELSQGWFDPWAMPGGFDPTGLVKGWATEQALSVVQLAGVEAAIVNGGGDIAVLGSPAGAPSWRIGIRHPWKADALACVLEVDRAVATSGCYERGPHLINPRDGRMIFRTASATVVGPSLALCDALATALVVADERRNRARAIARGLRVLSHQERRHRERHLGHRFRGRGRRVRPHVASPWTNLYRQLSPSLSSGHVRSIRTRPPRRLMPTETTRTRPLVSFASGRLAGRSDAASAVGRSA